MYQAVLSIRRVIDFAPQTLGAALVPTFSSLLASGNQPVIRRTFDLVQKTTTTSIILLALPMIAFSRELLGLFGKGYTEYYYLLALFSMAGIIRSMFLGNMTLLTSLEKNVFRLTVSTVQIALQLGGTFLLIGSYGILAIAGAKIAGVIIAQVATIVFVVYWIKQGLHMPWVFFAGIAVGLPITVLRIWVLPEGWWPSIGLCAGSLLVFWLLSGLKWRDLMDIVETLLRRRKFAVEGTEPTGDIVDQPRTS